jgi:AcrR family transcriptional regulator
MPCAAVQQAFLSTTLVHLFIPAIYEFCPCLHQVDQKMRMQVQAFRRIALHLQPNEHSLEERSGMEELAEKKRAILESTLELIKENGFHGTPMSLVAKQAGVAAGTIYHYFESKDELICELYSYVKERTGEALKAGDDAALTYQERFFAIWMGLFNFYIENPNVLRFFEQFVNSPYYAIKPEEQHDKFRNMILSFFNEGIEKGFIRPANPEILSVLLHGSSISTAKVYQHGKVRLGEEELKQIVQILWDGMSVR